MNKAHQRKEKGFTLIELVVVIVILGIIGLISIPKYVDMSAEAKTSTLKGQLGSIRAALATEYARRALNGTTPLYPTGITASMFSDNTLPVEPYTGTTNVKAVAAGLTSGDYDNDGGWVYSNTTGEVRADFTDVRNTY